MEKKKYKPSDKQIETLINQSEKYNTNKDHYDVITQISAMGSADVSYAIDWIQRKNDYGRQALPINNQAVRGKNILITKNPMEFLKEFTSKPLDNVYIGNLREQFVQAIRISDYGRATILYITLVFDNKDKVFKKEMDSKREELPEFFRYMETIPGKPSRLI